MSEDSYLRQSSMTLENKVLMDEAAKFAAKRRN